MDPNKSDDVEEITADKDRVAYLWGPQDSFNYTEPSTSRSISLLSIEDVSGPGDFVSIVTTISQAYRRGNYLNMRPLDDITWSPLDRGSTFQVSRSDLTFRVVSPIDPNQTENVRNRVVVKRIQNWSMAEDQVRNFKRELRILDHFQALKTIVGLRGIGWFYNAESVCGAPEPVLMLESAQGTMRMLMTPSSNISLRTMWSVFHDIASGLLSLHENGVVHGDIKPDNVLLFPSQRLEEGIEVRSFHAKLSDFNLAMFDNGGRQHKRGRTPDYQAPESDLALTFPQLKKTDVYSLGVVFAMVAQRTEDMRRLDTMKALVDTTRDATAFAAEISRRATDEIQGSTLLRSQCELIMSLFTNTLRVDPEHRNLNRLMQSFQNYFHTQQWSIHLEGALEGPTPSDLEISYGSFMDLSGIIKDQLTQNLLDIARSGDADPRYAKALFELGIIYLSRFSDPVASKSEGIQYIWRAAEKGDMRAQALYGRLRHAFECTTHPDYPRRKVKWLSSAILAGFQGASRDLGKVSSEMAQEALRKYGAACNQALFSTSPSDLDPLFILHQTAATGDVETLLSVLDEHPNMVDFKNPSGDTALLTACRFGQYGTARTLLRYSANASISNKTHENGLHFLWRFNLKEAAELIGRLIKRGADPEQEGFFSQRSQPWDLVPKLSGTPIERVAMYDRLDLVKLFIERGMKIVPRNGNQLRRMLLLAVRLQHVDMQKYLIEYASVCDRDFHTAISPLGNAGWEYKGKRRGFSDAAILGWARHTGSGIDVPVDFWQAAYHGKKWRIKMKATIDITMRLQSFQFFQSFDEAYLDRTIILAIQEKAYNAFQHLLHIKIMRTDGTHARLTSLVPLCWRRGPPMLQRPVANMNYVDQIYYSAHKGTLAQQAIRRGDRLMFHLLTWEYGANVSLPFAASSPEEQINCYSQVSCSQHRDLWFVHQFLKMNIGFSCPYEDAQKASGLWRHPLAEALCNRHWAFSTYLLKNGARTTDRMSDGKTVLDQVFALKPLPTDVINFLFPVDDPERSIAWWAPTQLEEQGGYDLFHLVYDAINQIGEADEASHDLHRIWDLLLKHYPLVENSPLYTGKSVLRMTIELYKQYFYRAMPMMSFNLHIVPSVGARITLHHRLDADKPNLELSLTGDPSKTKWQSAKALFPHFYFNSPMDDIPIREYIGSGLWFFGYFPSIRHPRFTRIYGTLLFLLAIVFAIVMIGRWIVGHWGQTIKMFFFGLVLAIICAMISLIGCFVFFGIGIAITVVGFIIQTFINAVIGVEGRERGIFINPDNSWLPNFSWVWEFLGMENL